MKNPAEGTGEQPGLPHSPNSDSTSKDTIESTPENTSIQATSNHHDDDKESVREPRSLETNEKLSDSLTNGEAAGHHSLREQLIAIETKLNLVDRFFGLQQRAAHEDDTDSSNCDSDDSDEVRHQMMYIEDSAYVIKMIRRSYETMRRGRKLRRIKAAELAAKSEAVDKAEPESARQISTAAFSKGEPSKVSWVDWDLFIEPKKGFEMSIMTPIDVVISEPEPQVIRQLTSRVINNSTWASKPLSSRPLNRLSSTEDSLGQLPLPERVKIHSGALQAIFSQRIADKHTWSIAADNSMVFLRPFKEFIYYEKQIRECLVNLEKRFGVHDGADNKPSLAPGADRPVDNSGDMIEAKENPKSALSGQNAVREEEEEEVVQHDRNKGESDKDKDKDEGEGEETSTSITALLHLRCLVGFIDDEIKPKLEYIGGDKCRKILFHDLWHLFKPGDEVVGQTEKQAYRIFRVQIPQHKVEDPWLKWWKKPSSDKEKNKDETPVTIFCAYVDFDGKQFGPVSVKFNIAPYGGLKDIKSLPIYPLRFAKHTKLRQDLIKRGKMLLDVSKFKPMYYMGFALDTKDEIDSQVVVDFSESLADESRKGWAPAIEALQTAPDERDDDMCRAACCLEQAVQQNDHIDSNLTENFVKSLIPDTSFGAPSLILAPRPLEEIQAASEEGPTDEEFVVMTYRVFAFVLRSRKWAQLDLTFLRYENTNARKSTLSAFERLELPDGHRNMVKSLVTQHFRDRQAAFIRDEQTDLIRGKGKGLILLLHGAPGVGKTTTAGDLGTTARDVEAELEKNFALASRWGCILLLDEADVFLSARERTDFKRNGLVAVFLRVLEYYAGILFLTTNRIGDFDEAFASRIHVSLYYPELDERKTRNVFKLNLDLIRERFNRHGRKITFDASSIDDFAKRHFDEHKYNRWNGRQIRNACQTALALAEFDAHGAKTLGELNKEVEVALQQKHFALVQTAYLGFARYLGDIRGTQGDRRAIDLHLRAKTDTPYQTTRSRFSAGVDQVRLGSKDGRHSQSETHYPIQSDPFQPLVNQGYPTGSNPEMGPVYGQYPQQGQPLGPMGNSGGGGYEAQQGFAHPGSPPGQTDPRLYQAHQAWQAAQMGFNQQGQVWGNPNLGVNYNPPATQTMQGQPLYGQQLQGQPQYGYVNMQHGVGTQNDTIPRADAPLQPPLPGGISGEAGLAGRPRGE